MQLSAYQEAIAHLTQGLDLLATLPDTVEEGQRLERARQELALQLALGVAWIGIGSASPRVGIAFARARELGRQLGETSQLCQALGELSIFHYVRAEHRRARELAEESLSLAQHASDPLLEAFENWHLGFILFALGEYTAARTHLERTIAFYDPKQHHKPFVRFWRSDAGVAALAYNACCLWCLGYPEQAVRQSQKTLATARELGHAFSLADALSFGACMFNTMRREAEALKDHAEELIRLATESGFPGWLAFGTCSRGEALARLGQVQEGIALMRQGVAAMQSGGVRCYLSEALCALAEAQARAGQPEEGLATLTQALALVIETDERLWEAEIHRVQAKLLLMQGAAAEAEASLHRAIELARHQNAKSWELRATVGLCRLWQEQGRTGEASRILAQIYGWFTEGFDTPDLLEARALLEELS